MVERIDSFHGPYAFLSNFHLCTVTYEGIAYPSSEHAYQAAKTLDQDERRRIATLPTPAKAKAAGKRVKLRDGWNSLRVGVMSDIVKAKFRQNQGLAQELLATGDAELVEGNRYGDIFWGVCRGKGSNWLGEVLMDVRELLQEEAAAAKSSNQRDQVMWVALLQTKKMKSQGDNPGWAIFGPFATRKEGHDKLKEHSPPGTAFPGSVIRLHDVARLSEVADGTFDSDVENYQT